MATIPSISMIPSGYKANKIYSVLPTDGTADLNFSRSGTATRTNSQGLIETVANGVPRLDYTSGSCPSFLLEPSVTNIITYSQDFSNWIIGTSILNANNLISPDGTVNASTITKTDNFGGIAKFNSSAVSGEIYTYSVFVKIKTSNYVGLRAAGATSDVRKNFNLLTGVVTNASSGNQSGFISSNVENLSNGWVRVSISFTSDDTTLDTNIYAGIIGTSANNGELGIFGAQLEKTPFATSLIPTLLGNAETRGSEFVQKGGLGSYIKSSEGVLFLELEPQKRLTNKYISLTDGTGNAASDNTVVVQFRPDGSVRLYADGTSNIVVITPPFPEKENLKIAVRFKENDWKLYINGIGYTSSFTPSAVTNLNDLDLGLWYSLSTTTLAGEVKGIKIYKSGLINAELETLSSYTSFSEMATSLNYTI